MMGEEILTERNQLSRQDASCFRSPRSPLGRTDDAFFELDDDDDLSSPSVPGSPVDPPSISVPLPPKSAPPCPTQPAPLTNGDLYPTILSNGTPIPNGRITPALSTVSVSLIHEARLQQSLSTPCNGSEEEMHNGQVRKESEYRRFKSEGSTAGASLPAAEKTHMDELSPVDQRSTSGTARFLIQQDSVVNPSTKMSNTEQVAMMHTLKTKLSKYQAMMDKAFEEIAKVEDANIIEGCTIVRKLMRKVWNTPKVSADLANALCDYLRDRDYFDKLIKMFISPNTAACDQVRMECGKVLEECTSSANLEYIVNKSYTKKIMIVAMKLNKTPDQQRLSLSLIGNLFKHSNAVSLSLIETDVIDHIILTFKRAPECPDILRHAALALANILLYTCFEGKKKIIQKKIPEWLFFLASQADDVTRYYACIAVCTIVSVKEFEPLVRKSDTMKLVEPFLQVHDPATFARDYHKYAQGNTKEWLERLLPMLQPSRRREARSVAAFHFTLEATIKKEQNKLDVFQEIGAIQALKEVASSPDEVAAKFASEALTVIGEEVPYKLAQQVPGWTCADVQYWVKKIGFEEYVEKFAKQMVDGDLLLQLTENDLKHDVGMISGLHRKRFLRELQTLKVAADYSSVDESNLDNFLMGLSPELSVYTYQMLTNGVNRSLLSSLTDEMMQNACGITNPIHRLKLTQAFETAKHPDDVEVAMLSKQIDVFISYRRSTGNQLASLIKVLLQLRGYRVFIDVDKLYAGKFDSSLLKNIQAAKHFILVLTPNSLDRLLNDDNCEDWVHKELKCAFEHQKNIIPIFDTAFEFPTKEDQIPNDIRMITKYNGVKWVHDYQDACMAKVVRFITGELNRTTPTTKEMPSISRKTTQQRWQTTNTVSRTGPSRSIGGPRMEPPTPTFFSVTPTGSQERATSTRRKIQPSASTTSDRN
uniref:ADP-ribosyl cyclase/cyclic ADP-ribose hydrolase n=2 Tax=Caenorhabditis elegans TaxID=6239 RepID=Q5I9W1_CAEEL|nr:Toll and interleukin 1 receptor domain protein isoform a [Caenorhabditis elegans]